MVKRVQIMGRQFWLSALLLPFMLTVSAGSRAQTPGDVIQIGSSPDQWSRYESYWNQLLNLGKPPAPPTAAPSSQPGTSDSSSISPTTDPAQAVDPMALEKKLVRNLRVNNLRLERIIKLNGSSQVMGSLTNRNSQAVTVNSINLEVIGPDGALAQTIAATPEPATIPAGATVTFQRQLLTVPGDGGYKVRLAKTPFSVQVDSQS
jgi:hypothetical protein